MLLLLHNNPYFFDGVFVKIAMFYMLNFKTFFW
jgi:hypothetical protein